MTWSPTPCRHTLRTSLLSGSTTAPVHCWTDRISGGARPAARVPQQWPWRARVCSCRGGRACALAVASALDKNGGDDGGPRVSRQTPQPTPQVPHPEVLFLCLWVYGRRFSAAPAGPSDNCGGADGPCQQCRPQSRWQRLKRAEREDVQACTTGRTATRNSRVARCIENGWTAVHCVLYTQPS